MPEGRPRAAVVGSGPSGFYAADALLSHGFDVDMLDLLPTPFGLVRAGVAPDHPKIKGVARVYEKTAQKAGFRFFGGVHVGVDVAAAELHERFSVVVYATGAPDDRALGIPGEDATGSHAAAEFVGWYNGHPAHAQREFDLSAERAVVIGNGNVAIDVARMLVLEPEELATTDMADHAIAALADSRIREVVVVGRRGPVQAAFTDPEINELGRLRRCDAIVDAAELALDESSRSWLAAQAPDSPAHRKLAALEALTASRPHGSSRRIVLRFFRSPLEIVTDAGRVAGVRFGVNRLERDTDGAMLARPTGRHEGISCGLVIRAVGHRGRAVSGIPFDVSRGVIPNDGGRVMGDAGAVPGAYVVGWIKRGPSGVIGTNKADALETVEAIARDRQQGRLNDACDADTTRAWLQARVPGLVSWEGWKAIDAHECARGTAQGRPRIKVVDSRELLELATTERLVPWSGAATTG